MVDKFPQKRPQRKAFIDKYGFEGDRYWRLELLKYEEEKREWNRREKGLKKYQNTTPAEKALKDKEQKVMAKKNDKTPKKGTVKNTTQKAPKKTVKSTPKVTPKKTAKPAAKAAQAQPKKTVAPAARKATVAKKPATPKLKKLMHDEKFELGAGGEKPIIISGKAAQPKRAQKVLRRVARTGGYTAWDARTGKTFATEKEANDYAADVLKKTGKIVPVSPTDRQVTHTFKAEQTDR